MNNHITVPHCFDCDHSLAECHCELIAEDREEEARQERSGEIGELNWIARNRYPARAELVALQKRIYRRTGVVIAL